MTRPTTTQSRRARSAPAASAASPRAKSPWQEPKLKFVEPKLTKQGEVKQITAGFIGTFVPGDFPDD